VKRVIKKEIISHLINALFSAIGKERAFRLALQALNERALALVAMSGGFMRWVLYRFKK
jgi:hypothetical protein